MYVTKIITEGASCSKDFTYIVYIHFCANSECPSLECVVNKKLFESFFILYKKTTTLSKLICVSCTPACDYNVTTLQSVYDKRIRYGLMQTQEKVWEDLKVLNIAL